MLPVTLMGAPRYYTTKVSVHTIMHTIVHFTLKPVMIRVGNAGYYLLSMSGLTR